MTTFSPQQSDAINAVRDWLSSRNEQVFRLFGYAGTGKTTLAKHLASLQNKQVRFGAFTGKAAKVLRGKGCDGASTIHSMIYKAEIDDATGLFHYVLDKDAMADVSLVIIDECSMVDEKLGRDLLSFGKPVLVLGDPEQLPPVNGGGFFTEHDPHFMLDEVHRQAAESPILRLATEIRLGNVPRQPFVADSLRVITTADVDREDVLAAGAVLVGRNLTRTNYNRRIRALRGYRGEFPQKGESLICLRNDRTANVMNGGLWTVHKTKKPLNSAEGKILRFEIEDQDQPGLFTPVKVFEHFFQGADRVRALPWQAKRGTQEFDYGYAITVHKSQGSQWRDVYLFDESGVFGPDRHRWLYTAVTRASEKLTVVI